MPQSVAEPICENLRHLREQKYSPQITQIDDETFF
jgi:hypothetical protein